MSLIYPFPKYKIYIHFVLSNHIFDQKCNWLLWRPIEMAQFTPRTQSKADLASILGLKDGHGVSEWRWRDDLSFSMVAEVSPLMYEKPFVM